MKTGTSKTFYACSSCGAVFARWMGQCTGCGTWNTLHEEKDHTRPGGGGGRARVSKTARRNAPAVTPLSAVSTAGAAAIASGLAEFDTVLGGGAVPGSTILIGGEPGVGKSTLLLQVAARMAGRGFRLLYVSGEESAAQIKTRAVRLTLGADFHLLIETNLSAIISAATQHRPRIMILDSIQTTCDPDLQSPPGTVSQVRECAAALSDWARQHDAVMLLVGHVTKDGFIAGPKVLEHLVDTVLQFEGDRRQGMRILRCLKNRFGSTREVGLFDMGEKGLVEVSDPASRFIAVEQAGVPGSAVAVAIEGRRPLLLGVQSLVGQGAGSQPQRVVSGFDPRRVAILIAVLQNIAGLSLSGRDIYLNITGGFVTDEPAVDLAAAMAIASSVLKKPVPPGTVLIGEVGLAGEIRSVPQMERRLIEAGKIGFRTAVVPTIAAEAGNYSIDIDLHPVGTIDQALAVL